MIRFMPRDAGAAEELIRKKFGVSRMESVGLGGGRGEHIDSRQCCSSYLGLGKKTLGPAVGRDLRLEFRAWRSW